MSKSELKYTRKFRIRIGVLVEIFPVRLRKSVMYMVSAAVNVATDKENAMNVGSHSLILRRNTLDAQISRVVILRYGRAIVRAERKMIHE